MHELVNTEPVFVHRDVSINDAVRTMIKLNVSSILIYDDQKHVVGILTERDIVHKFTLLDLDQKWGKTVGTIMTRPVIFADANRLEADVIKHHFELGLRHFPVKLRGPENVDNTVGIITVTDLCRRYLQDRLSELEQTSHD